MCHNGTFPYLLTYLRPPLNQTHPEVSGPQKNISKKVVRFCQLSRTEKKIYRQIGLLFWSCLVFGSLNTMCNFEKNKTKKTVSNNGCAEGAIFHFIMFKYFFREIAFMGFCTHQFCICSTYTIQSYTTNLDS